MIRATWCSHNPKGLTFPALRGGYRGEGTFLGRHHQTIWKSLLAQAGIKRHLVWHDLRHTGATALLGGYFGRKWRLEEIQTFLGHGEIKTTERYAHALQETLNDAARATWGDLQSGDLPAAKFDPEFDPAPKSLPADVAEMIRYARCDSNTRHSASKADALSS